MLNCTSGKAANCCDYNNDNTDTTCNLPINLNNSL